MKNNSFKSNFYYQIIPYLIRTLLVVLPFFIFQLPVQGQNQPKTITLKGQVTDTQGEPIVQAALIEVGTKNGTVTDVNGNFTIQVRKGAVLQVSFLGYQQQNVKTANKGDFIKIVLEEDAKSLDEVLVIGYGKTKRSEFTVLLMLLTWMQCEKHLSVLLLKDEPEEPPVFRFLLKMVNQV